VKKIEVNQCVECGKAILPQNVIEEIKEGAEYEVTINTEYSGYCLNCALYEVGGINIDECRVDYQTKKDYQQHQSEWDRKQSENQSDRATYLSPKEDKKDLKNFKADGRFPANLILTHHPDCEYKGEKKIKSEGMKKGTAKEGFNDTGEVFKGDINEFRGDGYADENGMETVSDWDCHSSCPVRRMNEQSGECPTGDLDKVNTSFWDNGDSRKNINHKGDKGGAARYFNQFHFIDEDFFQYIPKASKSERTHDGQIENNHPTVKPLELMEWLIKLVVPEGGVMLDPFAGSGTTAVACQNLDRDYILIEQEEKYCEIAKQRLNNDN